MQLLYIVVIVAAMVAGDLATAEPVAHDRLRLLMTVAAVSMVMLFAHAAAGITLFRLRQDFARRAVWMDTFAQWKALHLGLWAIVSVAILFGFQWAQLVRSNWQLADTFLLDEALILVPLLVPLFFSWAAFYEVDRTLERCLTPAEPLVGPWQGRIRYVLTHARHHLGLLLLPLFLVVAYQDATRWWLPENAADDLAMLGYLPLMALLALSVPLLLRLIWPTESLPAGPLRECLVAVHTRLGVGIRDILVWKTHRMITNAAVAGFVPRLRYVFLSDGLLGQLRREEIASIYAHELGHIRGRHLPLRVAAALLPVAVWIVATNSLTAWFGSPVADAGEAAEIAQAAIASVSAWNATAPLGLLTLMALYAATVMSRYSRLMEHEADLVACQETAARDSFSAAAAEPFADTLVRLTLASGQRLDRRSWLHPSVADRVAFLRRAAEAPADRRHFEVRMRRLARFFVGLLLLTFVVGTVLSNLAARF
ncbi:MAG: hypothetical protein DWQ42_02365 [Planctomycetota bacterium]|nr:MAG: hypothetical protein DWQ42_02365 [Planctomycetota bacterium]REK46121.1 MAG: hypothetical protein DWQ46_07145 [Planctomycetota bacterium]